MHTNSAYRDPSGISNSTRCNYRRFFLPTRGNSNIAETNALLHHGCYSKTLRFQNFPTRNSNAFTFGVRRFRNSIVRKFSVSQFLGFYRRSIQIYLFIYLSTSDGILFLPHKRTDRSCATNNTSKIRRSK